MKFPIKTPGDLLFVIILAIPVLIVLADSVSAGSQQCDSRCMEATTEAINRGKPTIPAVSCRFQTFGSA